MRTFIYILGICGTILFGTRYNIFNSKKFTDDLTELITVYYPEHKSMTQSSVFNSDLGIITSYKIKFSNGTIIEYGKNGKVIFAESYDDDIIPLILLPKHIQKHLEKNYLGINVIKYYADIVIKERKKIQ